MTKPLISAVICTYNRACLLETALRTLVNQSLPAVCFEIIVVDNNSSDDTRTVANGYVQRYPNVHYIHEPKQGLSHARNRGWQAADGDYVGYVDDECAVPCDWLMKAATVILRRQPAAFGGPFYGYYTSPRPRWWQDDYTSFTHSDVARPLVDNEYLSGGNMFIRRDVLVQLNGFDCQFGMSGEQIGYGEETDLQRRLRNSDAHTSIYFDPNLYLYHLVRPEKMRLRWALPAFFTSGRFDYRVFHNHAGLPRYKAATRAVRLLAHCIYDFTLGSLRRDRHLFPYVQNYWYERAAERLLELGKVYEQLATS